MPAGNAAGCSTTPTSSNSTGCSCTVGGERPRCENPQTLKHLDIKHLKTLTTPPGAHAQPAEGDQGARTLKHLDIKHLKTKTTPSGAHAQPAERDQGARTFRHSNILTSKHLKNFNNSIMCSCTVGGARPKYKTFKHLETS